MKIQDWAIEEFEGELRKLGQDAKIDWKESNKEVSRGCRFANFKGVTLMVFPEGLISIPAVCSYTAPSPAVAATTAKERFDRQNARDTPYPEKARNRKGGHLGPIVDHDLRCGNEHCPCQKETEQTRKSRARGSYNDVHWWETNTSWRLGKGLKE